jgi:hypothetical protein
MGLGVRLQKIKTMKKTTYIFATIITLFLASCNENEPKAPLIIPTEYDGSTFSANTTTQNAVLAALTAQVNEAKKGRTPGTTVTLTSLQNLYTAGSPSLKTVSTTYFAEKMEGTGAYLDELAKASGGTYTPGTPTGQGGTYGPYLFDENGLEFEQLIDKGQFGAVLYKHATDLLSVTVTQATVDQVIAIFGTNPTFPNTTNAAKVPQPDKFMAIYGARRDKNDGNGLYSQLKTAFIKLQVALKAGDAYKAEQQEAIDAIRLTWEKINGATMINYCQQATATLSGTSVTDTQKAGALHALGEGIGFAHGFKSITAKKITDTQLDEILVLLNAPATGTPTVYKFVTDAVTELPKLQQVITKLKGIYGFTDQEIEDFKNNWVSVQGR